MKKCAAHKEIVASTGIHIVTSKIVLRNRIVDCNLRNHGRAILKHSCRIFFSAGIMPGVRVTRENQFEIKVRIRKCFKSALSLISLNNRVDKLQSIYMYISPFKKYYSLDIFVLGFFISFFAQGCHENFSRELWDILQCIKYVANIQDIYYLYKIFPFKRCKNPNISRIWFNLILI